MTKLRKTLNEREKNGFNEALVILCALIVIFLLLDLRFAQTHLVIKVSGGSMETTVHSDNYLYARLGAEPQHGDVVILDVTNFGEFDNVTPNADGRKIIIKRVIGLPGDCVKCEDHKVYVRYSGETEFVRLDEPYVDPSFLTPDFGEQNVGAGEIFFLGDHRNTSHDSEEAGPLAAEVVGVVPGWAIRYQKLITGWENFRAVFGA